MSDEHTSGEGAEEKTFFSFGSGEDEETPEAGTDTSAEEPAESTSGDEEDSTVFNLDDGDTDSEDEEDEDGEDLLSADSESDDEGDAKEEGDSKEARVPRTRLNQQRDKFLRQIGQKDKEIGRLEAELETGKPMRELWQQYAERFKDPAEVIQADFSFMESVQALREDPEVSKAIHKVMRHMRGDEVEAKAPNVHPPKGEEKPEKDTSKAETTLAKRMIRKEVDSFLDKAKIGKEFRGPLRKEMVGNLKVEDLEDLSDEGLARVARAALKEFGWTPEQVQKRKGSASRPPTDGARSAAKASGKKDAKESKEDSKSGAFESLDQYEQWRVKETERLLEERANR